ncbi:hypothetical protein BV898_18404 [Hypsibius exemplaris]|uniref:Uncharacterized protein n=1 Tax=Hypsibius exemplaris TaxID=2072580 RepID=A0A9X6NP38_HYPEX|nr:hypothetical protein BV898_18404 [Hypsibius exemplaris]
MLHECYTGLAENRCIYLDLAWEHAHHEEKTIIDRRAKQKGKILLRVPGSAQRILSSIFPRVAHTATEINFQG